MDTPIVTTPTKKFRITLIKNLVCKFLSINILPCRLVERREQLRQSTKQPGRDGILLFRCQDGVARESGRHLGSRASRPPRDARGGLGASASAGRTQNGPPRLERLRPPRG